VDIDELLPALAHGLVSDSASQWQQHLKQLKQYKAQHGHAHCGFRSTDDRDLARWCKKQRSAYKRGELGSEMLENLVELGFELDADAAEWGCWYHELVAFHKRHIGSDIGMFTSEESLYLTHWCSVQRIARRAGVMPEERIRLLDVLEFDWTGADPLS
jgi:hypothetical protein